MIVNLGGCFFLLVSSQDGDDSVDVIIKHQQNRERIKSVASLDVKKIIKHQAKNLSFRIHGSIEEPYAVFYLTISTLEFLLHYSIKQQRR